MRKANSLFGQPVDVGRGREVAAVTVQIAVTHVVGQHEDDVRLFRRRHWRGRSRGVAGSTRHAQQSQAGNVIPTFKEMNLTGQRVPSFLFYRFSNSATSTITSGKDCGLALSPSRKIVFSA